MTALADILAAAKRQAKDHEPCLRGGHASQRCADADLLARWVRDLLTAPPEDTVERIGPHYFLDGTHVARSAAEARSLAADLLRAAEAAEGGV